MTNGPASALPIQSTTNYMVPSSGATHVIPVVGQFSGTPFVVDWRQFAVDEFPFQPQGVFVDNTQGAGALTITILPINWSVICQAGEQLAVPFPAPNGQSASIVGNGQASVMFADFPVLPYTQTAGGVVAVDIVTPNPVPVQPTVNAAGGLPYQFQEVPAPVVAFYNNAITGAVVTSGNIGAPANSNLRKLILSLSGNVSLAAAGLNTITAVLNGTTIYEKHIYIPAAATNVAQYWEALLDFEKIGLNAGAGALVVNVGTALATGELEVNAYFG
jgi:hypothetical protein